MLMEIEIDERTLSLINHIEKDFSKAVVEALNLWLADNIPACPFSSGFCVSAEPCNSCQKFIKRVE